MMMMMMMMVVNNDVRFSIQLNKAATTKQSSSGRETTLIM